MWCSGCKTFVGAGNLQMITNFDVNTYVLFLDLVLCIVLGSKEVEAFNLRS